MDFYRYFLRPLLFRLEAERAHHFALQSFRTICRIPGLKPLIRKWCRVNDSQLRKQLFGLDFPNPVGLAAGVDKDARYYSSLSQLGFGFIEIGTVTPEPQTGNPRPRLFRLYQDQALLNRMGFNNEGVDKAYNRLKDRSSSTIVGANIGKNKSTPLKKAYEDYEKCFKTLFEVVDYFVVNVSSPNTPQLRELQEPGYLQKILQRLQTINHQQSEQKPLLLKISPDCTQSQVDQILEVAQQNEISGIIATNTTTSRKNLRLSTDQLQRLGAGGISGRPLYHRSTELIRYISKQTSQQLPIIGVGGIHSPANAIEKMEAGADLVQLYTGFVYQGPSLIKSIQQHILNHQNT